MLLPLNRECLIRLNYVLFNSIEPANRWWWCTLFNLSKLPTQDLYSKSSHFLENTSRKRRLGHLNCSEWCMPLSFHWQYLCTFQGHSQKKSFATHQMRMRQEEENNSSYDKATNRFLFLSDSKSRGILPASQQPKLMSQSEPTAQFQPSWSFSRAGKRTYSTVCT